MEIIENRFNGIIVDTSTFPDDIERFRDEIVQIIDESTNKKLLWVKIQIEQSEFIPVLTKLGFVFHHCDESYLMLIKKLQNDAFVPTSMNFIVAVGAVVFHNGRLLAIKDRFNVGYKLPGGHIDKGETIKAALKREVFEETGVDVDFESIVNLGHFQNGQFGEANIYLVCTAQALSDTIKINDVSEIQEAIWIKPQDFLNNTDTHEYNKAVVRAAMTNQELKLKDQKIKLRVKNSEVFF